MSDKHETWVVAEHMDGAAIVRQSDGRSIAIVESKADAEMMAAAPELAEALSAIVNQMWTQPGEHFHPTDEDRAMGAPSACPKCIHDRARAALKKAGAP